MKTQVIGLSIVASAALAGVALAQNVPSQFVVSGKNADVMLNATADAIIDATLGYTMSVNRFYYLP